MTPSFHSSINELKSPLLEPVTSPLPNNPCPEHSNPALPHYTLFRRECSLDDDDSTLDELLEDYEAEEDDDDYDGEGNGKLVVITVDIVHP